MTRPLNPDWSKVRDVALDGAARLGLTEPGTARRIRQLVQSQGGSAIHVGLWEDDEAAVAVAGVEVWRGPRARIEKPDDA